MNTQVVLQERMNALLQEQKEIYLRMGYPEAAGVEREKYVARIASLAEKLPREVCIESGGHMPVLLVDTLVPIEEKLKMLMFEEKVVGNSVPLKERRETVEVPRGLYLAVDVELGVRQLGRALEA